MKQKFVRIRTKNPSAKPLRKSILYRERAVVRLGSITPTHKIFPISIQRGFPIREINKTNAIQISRDKLATKIAFKEHKIPQAEWWKVTDIDSSDLKEIGVIDSLPIVVKRRYGYKGRGMQLLQTEDKLIEWLKRHPDGRGWLLEKFYNYAREYRLHCSRKELFMAWRKLRREDANERWFFNSYNCNWVNPKHELFDEPSNWSDVIKQSIEAIKAVELDLGAVDVRIQSRRSDHPRFIICEVNSAPAIGEQGVQKYREIIKKILLEYDK